MPAFKVTLCHRAPAPTIAILTGYSQTDPIMALFTFGLLSAGLAAAQVDYSQYVDPLIGSEGPFSGLAFGGGDIFVGAALPFGVAKVGIDTYEDNVTFSTLNGGFTPLGRVTAISMMHESGTGGAPKYGIVPQMPLTTLEGVNILDNTTYWQRRVGNDTAQVGYFATRTVQSSGVATSNVQLHVHGSSSCSRSFQSHWSLS
ncbi:hypothetical protein LTR10_001140 [Elasticomyces elasticus]|nr:hypothetical protein LTR10_001140 [Elasticomyces elasticus]KAK4965494.1 hypothetical protein LTR42_012250 [Elasticomyces elasticus]